MVLLEDQNDNDLFFLAKLFVLVVFYQRCISYDCEQHQTCIKDVAKYMYVQSVIFFLSYHKVETNICSYLVVLH